MLNSLISGALQNRFMVLALTIIISIVGASAALRLPLDAVPDLTNIQVQVATVAALDPVTLARHEKVLVTVGALKMLEEKLA